MRGTEEKRGHDSGITRNVERKKKVKLETEWTTDMGDGKSRSGAI